MATWKEGAITRLGRTFGQPFTRMIGVAADAGERATEDMQVGEGQAQVGILRPDTLKQRDLELIGLYLARSHGQYLTAQPYEEHQQSASPASGKLTGSMQCFLHRTHDYRVKPMATGKIGVPSRNVKRAKGKLASATFHASSVNFHQLAVLEDQQILGAAGGFVGAFLAAEGR